MKRRAENLGKQLVFSENLRRYERRRAAGFAMKLFGAIALVASMGVAGFFVRGWIYTSAIYLRRVPVAQEKHGDPLFGVLLQDFTAENPSLVLIVSIFLAAWGGLLLLIGWRIARRPSGESE